jgi:methionyl-tRNA formyltransferase
MRIGLLGDGIWAQNTLKKLINDKNLIISFILPRFKYPDKKFCLIAKKNGIPILRLKDINSKTSTREILKYKCDLLASMSYNQIIGLDLQKKINRGIINCHAGKLPFYRGRSVLNWVLINGEKEFGITVHKIDDGIDTGDILDQKIFKIKKTDNYRSLLEKSFVEAPKILHSSIIKIKKGNEKYLPQKNFSINSSYYPKRKVGDEIINWENKSINIFNFTRALVHPGPIAETKLNDKKIKISKLSLFLKKKFINKKNGEVVIKEKEYFIVKTIDSCVKIEEWHPKIPISEGDIFS